jgi:hypothetical protein
MKSAFYFWGVADLTFAKQRQKYKQALKKAPMSLLQELMTKDIDEVLHPKEKTVPTEPVKAIPDRRDS